MLGAFQAAACPNAACMLGFDAVGTVVGGAITGAITAVVAILVFLLSKHVVDRGARRDSARMLLAEIGTITSQARPRIFGIFAAELYYTGAYDGLHKSGNIRHIPFGLHRNLAKLYGEYAHGGPYAVDIDAAVEICARLEAAVRDNRGYRERLRGMGRGPRRADER